MLTTNRSNAVVDVGDAAMNAHQRSPVAPSSNVHDGPLCNMIAVWPLNTRTLVPARLPPAPPAPPPAAPATPPPAPVTLPTRPGDACHATGGPGRAAAGHAGCAGRARACPAPARVPAAGAADARGPGAAASDGATATGYADRTARAAGAAARRACRADVPRQATVAAATVGLHAREPSRTPGPPPSPKPSQSAAPCQPPRKRSWSIGTRLCRPPRESGADRPGQARWYSLRSSSFARASLALVGASRFLPPRFT